jgi:aspartate/methionine/tyrosine aminotransferase
LIFSNEVYRLRLLEYDEKDQLPALIDVDDRGVSLGAMSKRLGLAGLRIGWIATGNRNLYTRLTAFKDYTTICNSAPSELIATIALRHRAQLIRRNLQIIHENLSFLNNFFIKYEDIFYWAMPKAGPIAFPSLRLNKNAKSFCRDLMAQTVVLLLPGSLYGDFKKNFRIGFGRADFAVGLQRFDEYLQKIQ